MKIDGHIHLTDGELDTGDFESKLKAAGFDGGLIISRSPASFPEIAPAMPFLNRLEHLLDFADSLQNLYPFFWIDPLDDDVKEQIDTAVSRGVAGFKIICNNYYPSDERAMKIFKAIAQKQKPLLLHSGILWDGRASSKYNKPVEFECLLEIDQLKFSLAHISWPWCDELIAVYGKFLNAFSLRPDLSCEMFIDLTPGTPAIYRGEILAKLLTVGYDVENNMIFGTDCFANDYNTKWAKEWVTRDDEIYDELGLPEYMTDKIYGENLRRFLGLTRDKITKTPPKQGQ